RGRLCATLVGQSGKKIAAISPKCSCWKTGRKLPRTTLNINLLSAALIGKRKNFPATYQNLFPYKKERKPPQSTPSPKEKNALSGKRQAPATAGCGIYRRERLNATAKNGILSVKGRLSP
ncbi:MAG: hypothetical protein NC237_08760, partial [Eubacterium sp.]|nr:hypothetical protein [Eubacterium sp.]